MRLSLEGCWDELLENEKIILVPTAYISNDVEGLVVNCSYKKASELLKKYGDRITSAERPADD
jgi:hypothetical protein